MSIHIQPISAFSDNYIWLIINNDKKQAIAIDTGDSEPVLNFLKNNNLELINVWITHHHNDHIGGVDELVKHFPNVQVFAHQNHGLNHLAKNLTLIDENDNLTAWQYSAKVWQTFGHTDSHLSFLLNVDKKILRRINELIKDIERYGVLEGRGKPKKLKYREEYSRRIDEEHRLIYKSSK